MNKEMQELKDRVDKFHMLQLPGQPMIMHMGTSHLVSNLWSKVQELEARLGALPEGLDARANEEARHEHRENWLTSMAPIVEEEE